MCIRDRGYTVAGTNGRMTEDGDTSLVWKWTNEALDATTYAARDVYKRQL